MKKRICIFSFYDKDGIVDDYVIYLLKELGTCISRLIIVVNGDVNEWGLKAFKQFTNEIYIRENTGYDAGAYKYVLFKVLSWNEIGKYDELLLTNDTYFGPLYPFEEMFETMSQKNCDYWGITRHPDGMQGKGFVFYSHIQSYLLNFKKNVIGSVVFEQFWKDLPICENVEQAVKCFEIGISESLRSAGFLGMSYMDDFFDEFQLGYNENPYIKNSFELIRDYRIPIIKRKCIDFDNKWFANALEAIKFIEENLEYDSSFIQNHMNRFFKTSIGCKARFDFSELELFVRKYKKLYIYGNGVWAKNMDEYFKYQGWVVPPHIVSRKISGQNVQAFDDIKVKSDEGIIIAVSKKDAIHQILQNVLRKCTEEQVLYPK